MRRGRFAFVALLVTPWIAWAAYAQTEGQERYRLLEGTGLLEGYGPPPATALKGTFDLRFHEHTPLFDHYLVEHFRAHGIGADKRLAGAGEYWIGGEVAIVQRMVLDVSIDDGPSVHLDSGWTPVTTRFPSIEITLTQAADAPAAGMALHLIGVLAYPAWFSTEVPFTAGALGGQHVSDGDLLTTGGSVLRTNHELTKKLGIQPPAPDIGLDASWPVHVGAPPHWVHRFSAEVDVFSEKLGLLADGDLLSEEGLVIVRNDELIAAFAPEPPAADRGLDAITAGPSGWPWFSVEQDFWSLALGHWVRHGDLLSQNGQVIKTNAELLAWFQLVGPPVADYGLDAVYVWPSGEIWFSTEENFLDERFGLIREGDLLSDAGWVVWRNLEMLVRFAPQEDLLDFGLDALHVVPVERGDMNGDAFINVFDIDPFVLALVDHEEYYKQYPELNPDVVGDLNFDGVLDAFDIDPFVALLSGG